MNIKVFSRVAAIMIMALVFPLTACDDDDWWGESRMVGHWYTESVDGYYATSMYLYGDGTGDITNFDGDMMTSHAAFYWRANRHHIYFDYNDGTGETWNIRFHGRDEFDLDLYGDYTTFYREDFYDPYYSKHSAKPKVDKKEK